jgi:hypothetical protein
VQHRNALRLTRIEKANTFEIDEIDLCQIQSDSASATPDLGFHLIKVLRPKLPAQPNPRSALAGNLFNLQHHQSLSLKLTLRLQKPVHSQLAKKTTLRFAAYPEF